MALVLVVAIYVALFVYYLQANVITQPYWDMLSIVTRYLQYVRDGNLWAYIWEPHVQHRHVWIKLLTALDARAFSGIGYPFVITAAACQATTAWLLWRVAGRERGEDGQWLGCLCVMLVLTSVAAVDAAIPINGIYPQTLLCVVASVVLFDVKNDSVHASLRRLLALFTAMGAAFGNAAALCLWPILVWLAWKGRAGRGWVLTIAAVGGLFGLAYLYRLPGAAVGADGSALGSLDMGRSLDYLVTYLGLPWTRAAALAVPGKLLGAMLLIVGSAFVLRGVFRPVESRLERCAIALVAFSLGTAVLAAVGRSTIDADLRVPVRYAVFVSALHVGVLMLVWPRVVVFTRELGRPRLLYAASLLLAVALTAQQVASGQAALATTTAMRATLARFANGEQTDDMRAVVYVDLTQARRDLNAIHDAGLYLRAR